MIKVIFDLFDFRGKKYKREGGIIIHKSSNISLINNEYIKRGKSKMKYKICYTTEQVAIVNIAEEEDIFEFLQHFKFQHKGHLEKVTLTNLSIMNKEEI